MGREFPVPVSQAAHDNHVEAVEADGKRSMAFAAVNISFINLSVTCRS